MKLNRTYRLILLLGFLAMLAPARVMAQQEPLIGQYMFNPYLINPAFAGYEGGTFFAFTASNQWAGYSKGPQTYTASAQTRIDMNFLRQFGGKYRYKRTSGKTGLGAMLFSDWNGNVSRNGFQGTYAYHTEVRGNDLLSMGVSLSIFQFRASVTNEDLPNPDGSDVTLLKAPSQMSPEANVGITYTKENFYVGLSANNLFQTKIRFAVTDNNAHPEFLRHYYVLGGYKLKANYAVDFEPSVLFTATERGTFNADINVKGYYKQDYWAGLSYRTSGSALFLVGGRYMQFKFGYGFNFGFGDVSALSKIGSHELMVGYSIGDRTKRYRWLRRY